MFIIVFDLQKSRDSCGYQHRGIYIFMCVLSKYNFQILLFLNNKFDQLEYTICYMIIIFEKTFTKTNLFQYKRTRRFIKF